jgi:hypothetical protein
LGAFRRPLLNVEVKKYNKYCDHSGMFTHFYLITAKPLKNYRKTFVFNFFLQLSFRRFLTLINIWRVMLKLCADIPVALHVKKLLKLSAVN